MERSRNAVACSATTCGFFINGATTEVCIAAYAYVDVHKFEIKVLSARPSHDARH